MLSVLHRRLPPEMVKCIMEYVYAPQPVVLLRDIRHFVQTKREILQYYHQYWDIEKAHWETNSVEWILNDLFSYSNDEFSTLRGYIDRFYDLFRRFFRMRHKSRAEIEWYCTQLESRSPEIQINVFWGLFTPHEREEFIGRFLERTEIPRMG